MKELGYNEPLTTYSEMLDVAKKLKGKYDGYFPILIYGALDRTSVGYDRGTQ